MSLEPPDLSFVHLHRLAQSEARVEQVVGRAWRVADGSVTDVLDEGHTVRVGDTVAVASDSELSAEGLVLTGGKHGRAHSFVSPTAFRPSPSRSDVPRLLAQLAEIERGVQAVGQDPLRSTHHPPRLAHETAMASEFARMNLSIPAARLLPEGLARDLDAVVLFVSEETAFVAFAEVDVRRLRAVMEALERPVNVHLAPADVVQQLIEQVYASD